jgi:shikimate kinase
MKNIYLVGFMGTGKSAVGRALSRVLKREFLEIDKLIELNQKRTINKIFQESGEVYFRKLESEVLETISKRKGAIVSCGGGIVIDKANIKIMKGTGLMICLTAKPKVILNRLKGKKNRPLLKVIDPEAKIKELLKKRQIFYKQAAHKIDTSRLLIKDVVQEIIKILSQNKSF